MLHLLELGFNPYKDNTALENKFFSDETKEQGNNKNNIVVSPISAVSEITTIGKALEVGLLTKSKVLNENSYKKFRSRIARFTEWLKKKELHKQDVKNINKNVIIEYLNQVLQNSSARNRNNTRSDLSSLFQTFVDNDFLEKNFIKDISVLKSTPTRNKTYTLQQQKQLYKHMEQYDPILLLFVKFVSYNFLRPIEVCRLRVGDIDHVEKKLYVRAKNQPVKTKIIPEILIQDLPDLPSLSKDLYLFTPTQIGGSWDIDESNKRTYFTGRFKKIKDSLGLGVDYGLYSFRHTFITKLYREIAKDSTPFATKSTLMLITGHSSMAALEKYLRDIDAELPEDYSDYLK